MGGGYKHFANLLRGGIHILIIFGEGCQISLVKIEMLPTPVMLLNEHLLLRLTHPHCTHPLIQFFSTNVENVHWQPAAFSCFA